MMAGGLDRTDWLLATVGDAPVASGVNANLLFAREEAGGSAGCNRFVASYASDGASTLTFGPIAATMMMCDEATMAFEQGYLAAARQRGGLRDRDADGLSWRSQRVRSC